MAKSSKATKAVLASLLATSAIVPAIAVNAEVGGETTRAGEAVTTAAPAAKTIDFKVEGADRVGSMLPTSGKLLSYNGANYIQLDIPASMTSMVNDIKVADKSIIREMGGTKLVLVPVSDKFEAVDVVLNLTVPFGANPAPTDYAVKLIPDAASIKEVTAETKPAEEKKVYTEGKKFESVADGTYDVKVDMYDEEKVGNYGAMLRHVSTDAKLIAKDGAFKLQVTILPTSNPMVAGFKANDKDATLAAGSMTGEPQVFEFDLASVGALTKTAVHVVAPQANMDKWYDFGIAIETADLELPKAGEEVKPETKPTSPVTSKMPVTVYKFGTQDLSIMHNKYLDDEVTVTATEGGYDVDVTFPEGQHLLGFEVEGATVAIKSEEKVGNNTVKIYTLSVKDLEKVYTATADLKVMLNGAVLYEEAHKLQLKFAAAPVAVPFKDIDKNGNKEAIINLYNKGIFKAADNFNPNNNLKRSQFALMLNRALKLDVPAKANFSDIAKYDVETKTAINALNGFGIINGKTATTFAPAQDVTRKQAALMIYRLLEKQGYKATGATANFSDMPKEAEAAKAIAELNKLGIISGFEGKFSPENKLTRSQMAKILNNTLTAVEGLKK